MTDLFLSACCMMVMDINFLFIYFDMFSSRNDDDTNFRMNNNEFSFISYEQWMSVKYFFEITYQLNTDKKNLRSTFYLLINLFIYIALHIQFCFVHISPIVCNLLYFQSFYFVLYFFC